MVGRVLKHYRIEEKLGEGGMGAVYRAWDERLRRPVAIKVLRDAAPGDARHDLHHEAAALLRLSHPRIGTIYDFDRADGMDFIVMEFVPGVTLQQRLAGGPLPCVEALAIAVQIAEAIEEAHEHDVVHRDLKPGNVVVSAKGQVKVLDFGLAKLLGRAGAPLGVAGASVDPTESHALAGTPGYMSPEQLLGRPVDGRTDIHALGMMLYEMVTGSRPFGGETALAVASAILHDRARPPSRLAPGIPLSLDRLVLRALEKEPRNRYPTAGAMLADLRAIASAGATLGRGRRPRRLLVIGVTAGLVAALGAAWMASMFGWLPPWSMGAKSIRSIAVLPLANVSGDPQQEYLADGMTDALIAELAQISALNVISRTSVMCYKTKRASLPKIAGELGVDAVVEGSVLRSGDDVRITVQLVEARNDHPLWARAYDRHLDNVLTLQQEVAQAISEEVSVKLTPEERAKLAGVRASRVSDIVPAAQESYLRGRYYAGKPSEAMLRISLKFFEDAIERQPNYALAHAGLASSWMSLATMGASDTPEACGKAKLAASQALGLDRGLAEGHLVTALARFYGDWDWQGAERSFKTALHLSPGNAQVLDGYSSLLSATGRHDEAIAMARRAQSVDPLSLDIRLRLGKSLYYARRFDEATEQFHHVTELDPHSSSSHYWLGLALTQSGRKQEALDELEFVQSPEVAGPIGYMYAVSGKRTDAVKLLADLEELRRSGEAEVSPVVLATICIGLGDKEKALRYLEAAADERAPYLTTIRVDPMLDALREEPRFAALVRRVGVPT